MARDDVDLVLLVTARVAAGIDFDPVNAELEKAKSVDEVKAILDRRGIRLQPFPYDIPAEVGDLDASILDVNGEQPAGVKLLRRTKTGWAISGSDGPVPGGPAADSLDPRGRGGVRDRKPRRRRR